MGFILIIQGQRPRGMKKITIMLILVFEVIVKTILHAYFYCTVFLGHYEPPQENNSDLREIDTPLENQDMRSRMTPDGGNPSEAKNNNDDDAKNSSPEKC